MTWNRLDQCRPGKYQDYLLTIDDYFKRGSEGDEKRKIIRPLPGVKVRKLQPIVLEVTQAFMRLALYQVFSFLIKIKLSFTFLTATMTSISALPKINIQGMPTSAKIHVN